jgi:hypothetical protein
MMSLLPSSNMKQSQSFQIFLQGERHPSAFPAEKNLLHSLECIYAWSTQSSLQRLLVLGFEFLTNKFGLLLREPNDSCPTVIVCFGPPIRVI